MYTKTITALKTMCEWAAAQDHEAARSYAKIIDRVDWSAPRGDEPPESMSVVDDHFETAVGLCGDNPLGDLARAAYAERDQLRWFGMYKSYDDDVRGKALNDGYAILRLTGPTGCWFSDDLTTAISIQSPHTWYPPHVHKQSEVYGVMSGGAEWQRGAEPWAERPSGDIVYHSSGIRHSIQTRDDPLICFACWIDHVHLPSVYVWD
jgi:mannose-6-phosphate isomerase-like protein (cupin superfamily)